MTTALARKDKQVLVDFDASIRDFNRQFTDQQRLLDIRTENKGLLVNDLQEFFKRRSELDCEYGKNLDRLCDRFSERIQKHRANYGLAKKDRASFVNLWSKLIIDAKFKAKTATTLSEIYSKNICSRLTEIGEDVQRIARNVKDTHHTLQQEILRLVGQLSTDMKDYYAKHNEYVNNEGKFRASENEIKKAEESPLKKGNEKRLKNLEKNMDKKRIRFVDSKLKAIDSRNTYLMGVESVSTLVTKYFDHDVSEIVDRFDHNFHNSFSSTLQAFIGAEMRMANAQIQSANSLAHTISIMDSTQDNKMFLEDNQTAFLPQTKFIFQPHADDSVHTITAEQDIIDKLGMEQRRLLDTLKSLQVELSDLQISMEKRQKGLEATYKKYDSEMNGFYHVDMTPVSGPTTSPTSTLVSQPPQQLKVDKEEWETGLLTKFKEYIMMQSTHVQAQSKYDVLTKALGEISADSARNLNSSNGRSRTIKLFGTSLKSQLDESGREIPEIIESCIKYIAKYGLDHQGIFRVPGANQEINDMKTAFEEGRDPLSGLNHWKDINAVAGVFRVYLREMAEPLFPFEFNNDYLRASSITRIEEQIAEATVILNKIPKWNLHVIKYLLKFLNLISRYSDGNKMTSHNLAVVFGPTLFRIPDNENLLTNQGQINVFIDVLINEFYQIFPDEPEEIPGGDQTDNNHTNEDEDEVEKTDDDLDSEDDLLSSCEAVAIYPYTARTAKEVSFQKGDTLTIYSRTNADWWDARVNGKFGFAPVPYIKLTERSSSTSDGPDSSRKPSKDSPLSPDTHRSPPSSPHPFEKSSSGNQLKSASVSEISSEMSGNVFASIDPTVQPGTNSPSAIRRSGSDRTGACGSRKIPPNRSHSDKAPHGSFGGSRKYQRGATQPVTETDEKDQKTETNSTISNAQTGGKQPLLPPFPAGGVKKLHHVSQPDINKGRVSAEPPLERPDSLPTRGATVKERSAAPKFNPIKERPVSALGRATGNITTGHMQIEPPNKHDHVPSFKPAPPPPALKPKPGLKKKDELAATLAAAAAAKKQNEGKDITHL